MLGYITKKGRGGKRKPLIAARRAIGIGGGREPGGILVGSDFLRRRAFVFRGFQNDRRRRARGERSHRGSRDESRPTRRVGGGARCAPPAGAVPPLGIVRWRRRWRSWPPATFRHRSATGGGNAARSSDASPSKTRILVGCSTSLAAMPRTVATPRRGLRRVRSCGSAVWRMIGGRMPMLLGPPPDRCGNWWIRRPVGWELVVQPGSWRFSRGAWHRPFAAPQQMPE